MKVNFILITIVLTSFFSFSQKEKALKLKKGRWVSQLNLSETDILPFEMMVSKNNGEYLFTVINGGEKIELNAPTLSNDSVLVSFPFFNSALLFKKSNRKKISGYWYNYNKGDNYKISFTSKRSKSLRFKHINKRDPNTSVNGRWSVTFEPNTNSSYPAVGVFKQCPAKNRVVGTFLTETGDYRYLAGNTTSDSLYLSCFDGSHAFLFKAKIDEDSLIGKFYSGNHWQSEWCANRNDTVELKNPDELTYMVDNSDFNFTLKDLSGTDFSFPNNQYKNKVTIIQIMGTWCPNCLDETQYYKELYNNYHKQGLEIISIGYETGSSHEDYANNLIRLKEKLNLDFKFIVGGAANKNLASEHFKMLNEVISFPTSIFIGRDGKVKRVHTGFNGPGTGIYYSEYVQKTNSLVESLLAQ